MPKQEPPLHLWWRKKVKQWKAEGRIDKNGRVLPGEWDQLTIDRIKAAFPKLTIQEAAELFALLRHEQKLKI